MFVFFLSFFRLALRDNRKYVHTITSEGRWINGEKMFPLKGTMVLKRSLDRGNSVAAFWNAAGKSALLGGVISIAWQRQYSAGGRRHGQLRVISYPFIAGRARFSTASRVSPAAIGSGSGPRELETSPGYAGLIDFTLSNKTVSRVRDINPLVKQRGTKYRQVPVTNDRG